ncbi:hypothetical protein [Streptomyces sp. NPDC096193]|uniref:hypothetical protein n=1 Tax=Streptomyces sp. NPDC096193 TaxID=3155821 RepID=UPI00331A6FA3
MNLSGVQLRGLRAAIFTALVVTLSAASHVLLSRSPLPWTTLAGMSAFVFGAAYLLSGQERGFWRIAGLLVPLELAADTVFTAGQDVCYGPGGGPVAGSLRTVGFDVLCGGSVGSGLPGVAADPGAANLLHSADPAVPWLLLAAHVSVGLLAAAWLRRGESALAGLLRAVGAFAFRPLLLAVAAAGAAERSGGTVARRAPVRAARAHARLLVHCVGRRGPPSSAAVLA